MSISTEVINIIEVLCQKFGIVIDWISETIMPQIEKLCKNFINYEIFSSIFWIGLALLCVIITLILFIVAKCFWDVEPEIITGLAFVISMVAFIIVVGVQGHDIVTAIYFPEKSIYDYITYAIEMAK